MSPFDVHMTHIHRPPAQHFKPHGTIKTRQWMLKLRNLFFPPNVPSSLNWLFFTTRASQFKSENTWIVCLVKPGRQ